MDASFPGRSRVGQAVAEALGDDNPHAFTSEVLMVAWEEAAAARAAASALGAEVVKDEWETLIVVGPDRATNTILTAASMLEGSRLLARALLEADGRLDGHLAALLNQDTLHQALSDTGIVMGEVPWELIAAEPHERTLAWALIALAESAAADLPFGAPVPVVAPADVLAVLLSDMGTSLGVGSTFPYDFDDMGLILNQVACDPTILERARLLSTPIARRVTPRSAAAAQRLSR